MALKLIEEPAVQGSKAFELTGEDGVDKLATLYRDLAHELSDVEGRIKIVRKEMLAVVNVHHTASILGGKAQTTITLPTTDGNKVMVIYQERYKELSYKNVPALKACFGEKYDLFVVENVSVGLSKTATLEKLKKACGDNWEAVSALLEIEQSVAPRKGAFENMSAAFRDGNTELGNDLRTFVATCIMSPQVRT